jgi:cysteine desulfurase
MRRIYFDHNATTPVHPEVKEAMLPYLSEKFGNPSSSHWAGKEVRGYVDEARKKTAALINADPHEIIFTGGGSEGDNLAIRGVLMKNIKKGGHFITTVVEHPAVIRTCKYLEKLGFEATYLLVDNYGMLDPDDVRKAIRKDTLLVSVMYANNETGNLYPIKEIAAIAKEYGVIFHTDAVQAVGKIDIDIKELGVDLLTASGHKFNAPKGVGFQYVRKGLELEPVITGGHQERGLRAGTENVPGIIGLGKACEVAKRDMPDKQAHLGKLRDKLENTILKRIPQTVVNGHRENRIYNTSNISFKYIESEGLLVLLDMQGIAVSTGSACSSEFSEPSHVLQAMHLDPICSRGALRMSLGYGNTEGEIDYVLEVLGPLVERLRGISPFYAAKLAE